MPTPQLMDPCFKVSLSCRLEQGGMIQQQAPPCQTRPHRLCMDVGRKRGHPEWQSSHRGTAPSHQHNASCTETVSQRTQTCGPAVKSGCCSQQAYPPEQLTAAAVCVLLYESTYVILQSCNQAKHARGKARAVSTCTWQHTIQYS